MGKSSNTTTTQTSPNPAAMGAYYGLLGMGADTYARNPWQDYGGEFVAPVNQQQYAGIGGINRYAEAAQPYIQTAGGLALSGATPITAGDIQNYYNPWQQNVVGATQAQFANMNAQQQQQVLGNAAAQGALGGDRTAVAQANLAGQQQLAQAPVIAGLQSQGFNQAAQLALAAKQQQAQGAYSLGNLGVAGQQAGLSGAGAQIQAGTLEQQNKQQLDAALYNQFLMSRAFPYQQLQWLAGLDTGVGSQMGGTSTTTGPPPSLWSQLGGLGLAGVGVLGGTGGFGQQGYLTKMFQKDGGAVEREDGGSVPGFDTGGMASFGAPLYGGLGFIPKVQITRGPGAPHPSGAADGSKSPQMLADAQKFAQAMKGNWFTNNGPGGSPAGVGDIMPSIGAPPTAGFGEGEIYARGGYVPQHGFDNGGPVTAAGFGMGSRMLRGYDEGGEVIELPPDQVPAEVPAEAMAAWRQGVDQDVARGASPQPVGGFGAPPELPPEIVAGTSRPEAGAPLALGYEREPAPVAGVGAASPSVADDIIARYRKGLPAATVPRGRGESAPWSSPESNLWPSLMAAGLGMMASKSPFPGVAIGEGGLQGLHTYQGLGREQRAEAMSQQKVQMAADNLVLQADRAQKELALHTKQFEESSRQHGASEKLAREQFEFQKARTEAPFGWTKSADGKLVPTPGGPHDPETIRAEAGAREKQFGWTERDDGTLVPTPGGPHDPATIQAETKAKRLPGMDDDALKAMVQSYRAGNTIVLQGIGRGVQGPENLQRFWNMLAQDLKGEGATGADLAAAKANFTAQSAAARTAAVREANVQSAIEEAKNTFPLGLEASKAVPRTQFVPLNRAIQMVQRGTSSPELARFVTANQAIITAYSQAMSRTGVNTVHAQQSAEHLLSTATSPEAYEVVLDQLGKEMQAAVVAPETVRQAILARIAGREPPAAAGPGRAPAPAPTGVPPIDRRTIGAVYQTPRGNMRWTDDGWVTP